MFPLILLTRTDTVFWLSVDKKTKTCYNTLSIIYSRTFSYPIPLRPITCRHDKHGVSTVDKSGPCDSIYPFFETSCLQIIDHQGIFLIPQLLLLLLPQHQDQYQLNTFPVRVDNAIHSKYLQQCHLVVQYSK